MIVIKMINFKKKQIDQGSNQSNINKINKIKNKEEKSIV